MHDDLNVISGYELLERTGDSDGTLVYKARRIADSGLVTIKLLDPRQSSHADLQVRFLMEANILDALRHPNIIRLVDLCEEPLAIITEWVTDYTLAQLLELRGRLTVDEALPLFRQIAAALACAHQQDVIHRNIHPGNILVAANGEVRVANFGVAKVQGVASITVTGTILGTIEYMSPEQIRGVQEVDSRADIYALGITLYQMLTGRPPFRLESGSTNRFAVLEAHMSHPAPDPRSFCPEISEALAEAILTALEKSPELRYRSMGEFVESVDTAL